MKSILAAAVLLGSAFFQTAGAAPGTNTGAVAPANFANADEAWKHLGGLVDGLSSATDKDSRAKLDRELFAAIQAFIAKYPQDPHYLSARMLWAQVADEMAQLNLPDAPPPAEVTRTLTDLLSDPAVPKDKRAEIRFVLLNRALEQAQDPSAGAPDWVKIDDQVAAFGKEYGNTLSFDGQSSAFLSLRSAEMGALSGSNGAGVVAVLAKLSNDPIPELAQMAQTALAQAKLRASFAGKPLDLTFTSVGGHAIDLAKLRGKVVLIDFWATWCPPCRAEMPEMVALYQRYHAQGLEIVGISLDQQKDALTQFVQAQGMTWPEFFDGGGWDSVMAKRFGISVVPTQWLVDKRGILVSQDRVADLAGAVEKLLKTP